MVLETTMIERGQCSDDLIAGNTKLEIQWRYMHTVWMIVSTMVSEYLRRMRDGDTTISAKPHHPEESRAKITTEKALRSKIKQKTVIKH